MASSSASSRAMLKAWSPGPELSRSQGSFVIRLSCRLHPDTRTQRLYFAVGAIGIPRVTAAAAMPDQPMAEHGPLFLRDKFHELRLDLLGLGLLGEAQAVGEARHVGVHDDADVHVEC